MTGQAILTLNAGSSSLKFSIYEAAPEPIELTTGQAEGLGPDAHLLATIGQGGAQYSIDRPIGDADHHVALRAILDIAKDVLGGRPVTCVGHRIAHGGVDFTEPMILSDSVVEKLSTLEPLAPLHQPHNLASVAAAKSAFPDAIQVGCFDTAFHRHHPWVNDTFALPRRFYDSGVRRYGFHGLSYEYITGELEADEPSLAAGKVVIAHLGNGASMCAVRSGRSIASTMGFSALDGLPMGTRCGQLDPGVILYLMEHDGLSAKEISQLLYRESGLKGLSGLSHDMRTLEASEKPEAKEAIAYFTFRIRRELGAMAAILGGLNGLVFCGGIGEHSSAIRAEVCADMEWLGIELDHEANTTNQRDIGNGSARILVIPTDEERIIARACSETLLL